MCDCANEKILIHIDPDLEELIPGFLENRQKDITSIRTAIGAGDFETIQTLGHNMKGTGAAYGFDDLTDIGAKLEIAGKEKDKDAAQEWFDKLVSYLGQVDVVYDG